MTTHTAMPNHKVHEGRNIKRFREMLGIKQDALAFDLNMSQQAVSLLEQKETIDTPLLQKISALLKIPVEAIQNFDEEQAVNIISNTFHEGAVANNSGYINCTFNPIDELRKIHDEKIALYERMLKEKDEIMARLEQLLNNR